MSCLLQHTSWSDYQIEAWYDPLPIHRLGLVLQLLEKYLLMAVELLVL